MPYKVENPPDKIKNMPAEAIEAWVKAFNAAEKLYEDPGKANAVAYSAIKKMGYKKDEKEDKWVKAETKDQIYNLILADPGEMAESDEVDGKHTFRKKIITVGTWKDPQSDKKLEITRERMEKWIKNFEDGVTKIFVPLRHTQNPLDNTGWVSELKIEGDALYAYMEITHPETIEAIKAGRIQDVSLGLSLNFIDSHGKPKGEVIEHIALTLVPYIPEQGNTEEGKFTQVEVKDEREQIWMERIVSDKGLDRNIIISEGILPDDAFACVYEESEYVNDVEVKRKIRKYPHHDMEGKAIEEAVIASIKDIIAKLIAEDNKSYQETGGMKHLIAHYQDFGKPAIELTLEERVILDGVILDKEDTAITATPTVEMLDKGIQLDLQHSANVSTSDDTMNLDKGGQQDMVEMERKMLEMEKQLRELEAYKEEKEKEDIIRKVEALVEATKVTPAVKGRIIALAIGIRNKSLELEGQQQKSATGELLDILNELPERIHTGELTGTVVGLEHGDVDEAKMEAERILTAYRKSMKGK